MKPAATRTEPVRVMVCGASPDDANMNAILRADVVDGFVEILGREAVAASRYESAARSIRRDRPELVLMFGSCLPDSCEYASVRRACDETHARLAFWLHDDPYEFDTFVKVVGLADLIFSNDRWASEHYPTGNVQHLPMAANPRRFTDLSNVPWDARRHDVFFCGVCFPNRRQLFEDLAPTLRQYKTDVCGSDWPEQLAFCRNERMEPSALLESYATARVVLNVGRTLPLANTRFQLDASTPGPRTFEAAMAGGCQMLFADSLEVLEYFELDREIVLFNDADDFRSQLAALLEDCARTTAIGAAARRRALAEHTFAARTRRILEAAGMAPLTPAPMPATLGAPSILSVAS